MTTTLEKRSHLACVGKVKGGEEHEMKRKEDNPRELTKDHNPCEIRKDGRRERELKRQADFEREVKRRIRMGREQKRMGADSTVFQLKNYSEAELRKKCQNRTKRRKGRFQRLFEIGNSQVSLHFHS